MRARDGALVPEHQEQTGAAGLGTRPCGLGQPLRTAAVLVSVSKAPLSRVPQFGYTMGFPGGLDGKDSACSAGDQGSIPGSGRSPAVGNPLQDSCLENPMDRGAWWAAVHGVAKSWTQLSDKHFR